MNICEICGAYDEEGDYCNQCDRYVCPWCGNWDENDVWYCNDCLEKEEKET
jgi:hypothetical protein